MPIQVLSEALSSRIAAGEVIERPASVVKELVENSLDAGATRVEISIRDGGVRSISVVDNGSGISPGELSVAFERFATSKIDETSDLTGISTLGFRGEALPSIASVARVEAVSRVHESDAATRCVFEYGHRDLLETTGAAPGTSVSVTGLFRNVPARLKFLGSPGRELNRIQQLVATLALVYPNVAFKLTSDGKLRIGSPGTGDTLAAVAAVYGSRVGDVMLKVDGDSSAAFGAVGLISAPSLTRGNRNYITLAVNGRWVQSRRLIFAIEQAYHGFLPERRFPVAIVDMRIPYNDVDVNVHPAKAEVRFLREDIVFSTLQRAIRGTLTESAPVHGFTLAAPARAQGAPGRSSSLSHQPQSPGFAISASWPAAERQEASSGVESSPPGENPDLPLASAEEAVSNPPPRATHKGVLPVLRVIGQARETYILAEGPDGVYLIDQHAAHERVLYEEIRNRFAEKSTEMQALLEPETVELSPTHASIIEAHMDELVAAGFTIEPFGQGAVLLRTVPQLLVNRRGAGDTLITLLDDISERGRSDSWQDKLLYTMACHSSVRAGQTLSIEESKELIRKLEATQQPHTCPHGRPTMIHLTTGVLDREFRRS
ncbi:MAG: DNA mismatch repair endonuclease MutL [Dehalococcoidia bacterium]